MTPPKPKELLMASFCCGGSLHGRCLISASSHGPGMGFSRLRVCGAALSLSAKIVKTASTAPAKEKLSYNISICSWLIEATEPQTEAPEAANLHWPQSKTE